MGTRTLAAVLSICVWLPAATAVAQTPAGTLSGSVLDADSGAPVAGALVVVEPTLPGLVADVRLGATLVAARSVVTGASGTYRFTELPPGQYRLRIDRLGYRAATVVVDLRRPADASVSVALELAPVELERVEASQRAASLFQRAANAAFELDEARIGSERARQDLFLAPDARIVTYADVMDGVTLGEGDVFRALQRFPGVTTRDDYTAELWTRGAPWTHTRVTFDGIPLFNPVHAVGVLSAITPEVLGAVFFHPGVRPASVAEGAAGVVDLRTRPGMGDGEVRGVVDGSMASGKLALEQHVEGRGSWSLAARRSHLGILAGGLDWLGLESLDLPFVFHDVAGRVDVEPGRRTRLEVSGLSEQDRLEGDVEGVLERTRAHWGNTAGRATLHASIGRLGLSHTLGGSRFGAHTDSRLVRTREATPPWIEPESRNEIEHVQVTGELAPIGRSDAAPGWAVGYGVAWNRGSYVGPTPRYHAVRPDVAGKFRQARELRVGSLWGERRIGIGERLVARPGLRVEAGDRVLDAPPMRLAPRLALRYAASDEQSISVAAGRSWQYVQAIGLAGPSIHPAFHASHFWVFAAEDSPALRADIVSIGTERWLGGGWLASVTAFARHTTGVTLPDPRPGQLGARSIFVVGENRARGVDSSLRRLGASWSASLGYSLGASDVEVRDWRYPSPADRRHILDAMLGVRLVPEVRVAAAFTAMSGAPFTRAYTLAPQDCTAFGFGCGDPNASFVQDPNAERTPAYRSLDVSLHWGRSVGRFEATAYAQVRNLLNRDNASTYAGTVPIGRIPRGREFEILWDDRFERALPRLPLVGARVTF